MRTASSAALVAIGTASVLLTGSCRASYLVSPTELQAARNAPAAERVVAMPARKDGTLRPGPPRYLWPEALRVESAPPGAPYWTVSARRDSPLLSVGGVLLGSGLASLVAGAAFTAVALAPVPCGIRALDCNDGPSLILNVISAPLFTTGVLKIVVGSVLLGMGASR